MLPGARGLRKPTRDLTGLETRGFGQGGGLREQNPLAHTASVIELFLWSGLGYRHARPGLRRSWSGTELTFESGTLEFNMQTNEDTNVKEQ